MNVPSLEVAVAECVRNAIDAHATSVQVSVDASACSFSVSDNGDGVTANDFALLFVRSATGKGQSCRGECLASIVWSSLRVSVTSRAVGAPRALCKSAQEGRVGDVCVADTARAVGTTVDVFDLFRRLPVRRASSFAMAQANLWRVKAALEAIAIAHPALSVALFDAARGVQVLRTRQRATMLQTFLDIHGADYAHSMRPLDALPDASYCWSGWTSLPLPPGHSNKELQLVFVNRRHLGKTPFHKLVNRLYRESLVLEEVRHRVRFPIFILSLECSPDLVDFSLDPGKSIVEFADIARPLRLLEMSIRKVIHGREALPKDALFEFFGECTEPRPEEREEEHQEEQQQSGEIATDTEEESPSLPPATKKIERRHSDPALLVSRLSSFLLAPRSCDSDREEYGDHPVPNPLSVRRRVAQKATVAAAAAPRADNDPPRKRIAPPVVPVFSDIPCRPCTLRKDSLLKMRVLAQLEDRYIIAACEGAVWAFDQHAVHERVRLEQLEAIVYGSNGKQRQIDHRIGDWQWPLGTRDAERVQRHQKRLIEWGYDVKLVPQSEGGRFLRVWKVPVICGNALTAADLCDFLSELDKASGAADIRPPGVQHLLALKACRSAIKFGTPLSMDECTELLRQLADCRTPFQCAHGRPNVFPLFDCAVLRGFSGSK